MARKRSALDVFRATTDMSEKDRAALQDALDELFHTKSTALGEEDTLLAIDPADHNDEQDKQIRRRHHTKRAHHHPSDKPADTIQIAIGPSDTGKTATAGTTLPLVDAPAVEEDDEEEPPHPMLWHFSNQSWLYFALTVVFCIVQRAVNIIADLIVANWAARKAVFGNTLDDAGYATWYGVAIAIFAACLVAFNVCYFVLGASHAVRKTHAAMLHRLLYAPTSFFDTNTFGSVVSRFARDLDCVDRTFVERLNSMFYTTVIVFGSCVLMCYAAPYLTAVLAGVAVIYALVLRYFYATAVSLRGLEAACRTPMITLIGEALNGLDVIRSYGISGSLQLEHEKAFRSSHHALYNVGSLQLWFGVQLGILYSVIILVMTVMVTGLMASYDHATRTTQLPVLSLAVTYTVSLAIGYLMNLFTELQTFYGSVERTSEYATCLEQEAGAPKAPAAALTTASPSPSRADDDHWPSRGGVKMDNVCLRYRPELPLALNGLTITIQPGEHIGVVGRTGSGKSTLIQALFRLVELDCGRVVLDGVTTSTVPLGRLRSAMTIVPQDPMLFQGTVRSNIDPLGLYSNDVCEAALRRVGLYDERSNFTLSSTIDESGANLSTGQRQLLCLARAMVRSRKILVMDEATANVDGATDERMQEIVRTDFATMTTITIAHRIDTIIDSDRILVMDKGRMVEFDTPRALLAKTDSIFYSIASGLGGEQLQNLIRRLGVAAQLPQLPACM
jgi:ATP-binding cassette, subfamily C (CFTR/MRP), member 1